MDEQLIEKITKSIITILTNDEAQADNNEADSRSINQSKQDDSQTNPPATDIKDTKPIIGTETISKLSQFDGQVSEEIREMQSTTPARIGVGRSGPRPRTNAWLKFRYDHAAAVDTVAGDVEDRLLEELQLFAVTTEADNHEVYIRRPDYGRRLSEEARKTIKAKCTHHPNVQIIVSDGLSSKAIEENLEDVYLSLEQSLQGMGYTIGTPFYIERGRVAVMDDIGELLEPDVVVLLIGERPGLVSAESLSAYLCYRPRLGTIEADRMVVSNIHKGGIPPVEAGAYLGTVVEKVLKYKASGISLVQMEE